MSVHRALSLMSRKMIDGKALITHTFPLKEMNKAISTFTERREGAIKVVVHP
jgi:threonine dehydrogenase-like Zn-dependent dehydrogenase